MTLDNNVAHQSLISRHFVRDPLRLHRVGGGDGSKSRFWYRHRGPESPVRREEVLHSLLDRRVASLGSSRTLHTPSTPPFVPGPTRSSGKSLFLLDGTCCPSSNSLKTYDLLMRVWALHINGPSCFFPTVRGCRPSPSPPSWSCVGPDTERSATGVEFGPTVTH